MGDESAFEDNANQMAYTAMELAENIRDDFNHAVWANQNHIEAVGKSYAKNVNRILKDVYYCEPECVDRFTSGDW